jgi:hypothetical protein
MLGIVSMRIVVVVITVVVVTLNLRQGTQAAIVVDSSTTFDATNEINEEATVIKDGESPRTVVTVVEGGKLGDDESNLPIAVELGGTSVLRLLGGEVGTSLEGGIGVLARESSMVIVDSGKIDTRSTGIRAEDDSQVLVSGGFVGGPFSASIVTMESTSLDVIGGQTDGGIISLGESVANIRSGELFASMYGASSAVISAQESSTVNIYGGQFSPILEVDVAFEALDQAIINVFGFDLAIDNGRLTGRLSDSSPLDHGVLTQENGRILLHNVPEPSSVLMAIPVLVTMLRHRWKNRVA